MPMISEGAGSKARRNEKRFNKQQVNKCQAGTAPIKSREKKVVPESCFKKRIGFELGLVDFYLW